MDGLPQRKRRSSSSTVVVLPLFLAFFLAIFLEISVGLEYSKEKQESGLRLLRIQKHLEKINKAAVISIESPDGDIIDCIDQWKQPAFNHPLLKNHELQLVPTEMPKTKEEEVKGDENISGKKNEERIEVITSQVWHQNETRCPKGTVPIRRIKVDDLLRAQSLHDFGRKQQKTTFSRHTVSRVSRIGHEYAYAAVRPSEPVFGAVAAINLWNPSLQVDDEMSISQIWVAAGQSQSGLNTIESGWQVNPHLYGDKSTRFFVYWTADGYKSTGCYNTLCAGFVQVDKNIVVGMAIAPVSAVSGKQFEIKVEMWKDTKTKNWWLGYGNNKIPVGYWPAELFTDLKESAMLVEWGGEVTNSKPNGAHSSTQMGSGHFAEDGPNKASYFRNLGVVDSNNGISPPKDIIVQADNSNCYSINLVNLNNEWGTHFYYGGPGFNPKCP